MEDEFSQESEWCVRELRDKSANMAVQGNMSLGGNNKALDKSGSVHLRISCNEFMDCQQVFLCF